MWRSKVISTRWYACFIRQTDNPLQVEKEIMSVGDLATALVCLAREKKKKKASAAISFLPLLGTASYATPHS